MSDITSSLELVTPEMAALYLRANTKNRPVRKTNIAYFAKLLRKGEFLPTHQGIAFSSSGRMLDGQHRCLAIIETDIGAWMLVTRGLEDEAFKAIDFGGVRRTYSDITGLGPRAVAASRFIVSRIEASANDKSRSFTPDEIAGTHKLFKSSMELVLHSSTRRTPVVSSAGAVAGATLRSHSSGSAYASGSIARMIKAVSNVDLAGLTPVERCFCQRVLKGRFNTRGQLLDVARHAWIATSEDLKDFSVISSQRLDVAADEMREVVQRARNKFQSTALTA